VGGGGRGVADADTSSDPDRTATTEAGNGRMHDGNVMDDHDDDDDDGAGEIDVSKMVREETFEAELQIADDAACESCTI
jgi:hypothetical protein